MALEAGKHVLVEARMAMNAREALEMLAASRRSPHLVAQVVPSPFTLAFDQMLTSFMEGVKYMEFTEAVARSADHGVRVTLPLKD